MWPAAHIPRTTASGSSTPASVDGIQSASSTHECAAVKTPGATDRQCQIFDQNHSDEYRFPHFAMYSGRIRAATSVMRAASRQLVWSFQSQHWAARSRRHFRWRASGRLRRSTGIGLDPVVSTPMPATLPAENPRVRVAAASAPRTLSPRAIR